MTNSSSQTIEIKFEKILLVEGNDEENFLKALLLTLKINSIDIVNCGGCTNMSPIIKGLKNLRNFGQVNSVGIIRDADTNADNAFKSLKKALKNAGLPVPNNILESAGDKPKVTIMILPDGKSPGMIEDICLASVKTEPTMSCVDNYFKCLGQDNPISKAKVKVYLASKPEMFPTFGVAALHKYWPLEHPAFNQLKEFILSL